MNEHIALEAQLENALDNDTEGTFLKELQRSLREFSEAVELHLREGVSTEQYRQWEDLRRAATTAARVAEVVHQLLHEK
jgi:hypothetical protein